MQAFHNPLFYHFYFIIGNILPPYNSNSNPVKHFWVVLSAASNLDAEKQQRKDVRIFARSMCFNYTKKRILSTLIPEISAAQIFILD
jgi:hypothetical protein